MQIVESRALFNFTNSIDSPETKAVYLIHLKKFMLKYKSIESFLSLPVIDIENALIDHVVEMKGRGLSTSYISVSLAALKHLCVMNDIRINKEKISKFIGEHTKLHEDRPYTHEEIYQLLNVCDLRLKVIILLLASTGMRIGALPSLKMTHVTEYPLSHGTGACRPVTVYADTKDKYITFMTPECRQAVDSYLEYRTRSGEKLTPDSPLIREQFDINDMEQIRKKPKFVARGTYSNIIKTALIKSGLRIVNHNYGGRHRHDVTLANGFRKFFTNAMVEADLKTEYRWLLEGHNLKGNDSYYVRVTEKRLQQEYSKAINLLTIDPTQRLKRELVAEKEKNTETSRILARLIKLEEEIGIKI